MAQPDRQQGIAKLNELIRGIHCAMLTTRETDGTLRSRPMVAQQTPFDGDVWFFTRASAPKVAEIQSQPQVNVSYADAGRNAYVSLSGKASLVRDKAKAKELWNKSYEAWCPKGPDDPDLGLIRVIVEQGEYYDPAGGTMLPLPGFVRAKSK